MYRNGRTDLGAIHKKLSDDKKIAVDFAEKQFMDEFNKAKEDFRQQQLK